MRKRKNKSWYKHSIRKAPSKIVITKFEPSDSNCRNDQIKQRNKSFKLKNLWHKWPLLIVDFLFAILILSANLTFAVKNGRITWITNYEGNLYPSFLQIHVLQNPWMTVCMSVVVLFCILYIFASFACLLLRPVYTHPVYTCTFPPLNCLFEEAYLGFVNQGKLFENAPQCRKRTRKRDE